MTHQVDARGNVPNTGFIGSSLGSTALTRAGNVKVRPTLQLQDYDDIFAAGDIIDWNEQKQAAKTTAHAAVVSPNVLSYLQGKPVSKVYKGSMELIVITNGKVCPIYHRPYAPKLTTGNCRVAGLVGSTRCAGS